MPRPTPLFNVTFETITEESASEGDFETNGFICEDVTLREALEALEETPLLSEARDPKEADGNSVRVFGGLNDEGGSENRTLHFPDDLSDGSRARIARLLGAKVF